MRLRRLLLAVAGSALLAGGGIYLLYRGDMRHSREAAASGAQRIETEAGLVEYAERGNGPTLLSIHGAGGGFDQGISNALGLAGEGFRVVAPSRFGYLGTPVPADASPMAQADAHAALLTTLGVRSAAVLGVSAGTRSALELALRHPEKVSALVLIVPATWWPGATPVGPERGTGYSVVLWLVNIGADFTWWAMTRLAPSRLASFIGVPPQLFDDAAPPERKEVMDMIDSIQPLSLRFRGINIDSAPDLAERPLEALKVPTLIISARDDLFGTLPPAEYAATRIPGAKLVVYDKGGHLLVGHGAEVRLMVRDFLAAAGSAPVEGL